MRLVLILSIFVLSVLPSRSFSVHAPGADAPVLTDAASVQTPADEAPRVPLTDEETQEDGDSAVLRDLANHHGQLSVPYYHEYLIVPPAVRGYKLWVPPDENRA